MGLYQNHQWAVTDDGIESVEPAPTYYIAASRLTEMGGAGEHVLYDWPVLMAEKTWVDIAAFIQAFEKALEIHAGNSLPLLMRQCWPQALPRLAPCGHRSCA